MEEIEKDMLCLIIDLEGFVVNNQFQTRELGYYTWQGDKGVYFFDVTIPYRQLSQKDRGTVAYVSKCITGLPYRPNDCERPVHHQRALKGVVKQLFCEFRTDFHTHVGFKGGHFERDLLMECGIPFINIENWGCPKYDDLPKYFKGPGCGCHADPEHHHCPQSECEAFWTWTRSVIDKQSDIYYYLM